MALSRLLCNIVFSDERIVQYPIRPALILYFEKAHNFSINKIDENYEMCLKLAWEATRAATQGPIADFDTWIETVDGVEMVQKKVDPTPADQSGDTSHMLRSLPGSPRAS